MASEYEKTEAGERFELVPGEVERIGCCDCGLVHDFIFEIIDGKLYARAWRNNRATAQRRRHNTFPRRSS